MIPLLIATQVFAKDVGTTAPQESLSVCEVCIIQIIRPEPVISRYRRPNEGLTVWQINTRVKFKTNQQNVTINPGDYLVADLNGVVCIPQELAEKIVALIPSQVEADERIARDLQAGRNFVESSKEHRASVKAPSDV